MLLYFLYAVVVNIVFVERVCLVSCCMVDERLRNNCLGV